MKKTIVKFLFVSMLASLPVFAQASWGASCQPGSGTDYPVGPGQTYATLADVPWDNLGPGDTVRIHYRSTPYQNKIVIRTSGAQDNPIRICGVPGPNGERPILEGSGAVNDPDDAAAYGGYAPMQGLGLIMIYNQDYHAKDSHIVIDGLHLRNAKPGYSYTRTDGTVAQYESGAACIRVQAGDDIVIRNNELENCANGIFTMSQNEEAHLTRDILIEGNYIHQSGQSGSYLEHGAYIQAIGTTIQFNRFGPNAAGAMGATLKDRSAGTVIRYNYFESGSVRPLDLVEVEDAAAWYLESEYLRSLGCTDANNCPGIDQDRLQKVRTAEAAYRKTYVYGNFFDHVGSQTAASNLVHYGSDNDPALSRGGTLYFYNNTVSIKQDLSDEWRYRLFYLGNRNATSDSTETVEMFNNIIYFRGETGQHSYFCFDETNRGTINIGVNWLSNYDQSQTLANCYYGDSNQTPRLNGLDNLIDGTSAPAPLNNDLDTLNVSEVLQQAQALPSEAKPVDYEYVRHLNRKARAGVSDLGAQELSTVSGGEGSDNGGSDNGGSDNGGSDTGPSSGTDNGGGSDGTNSGDDDQNGGNQNDNTTGGTASNPPLPARYGAIHVRSGGKKQKIKPSRKKTVNIRKKKVRFKGTEPALIDGRVEIYRGKRLVKTAIIDKNGRWQARLKFKRSKTYKLKFVFKDKDGRVVHEQKIRARVDTKKPRFTDLRDQVLRPGEWFDWKAKDNRKIVRYTYRINGKKYKTKRSRFKVPNLPPGVYQVKITAYDKAGNKRRGYAKLIVR